MHLSLTKMDVVPKIKYDKVKIFHLLDINRHFNVKVYVEVFLVPIGSSS